MIRIRRLILVAILGLTPAIVGCESEEARLARIAQTASVSRDQATRDLLEQYNKQKIDLPGAMDLAFAKLDSTNDESAAPFAGAVLDFARMIDADLPKSEQFFMMWWRVGQLAARAAALSMEDNRLEEARSLVLAGPDHWQSQAYWQYHPDHDALASLILARTGEREEAIRRLRSRPLLSPPADDALRTIERMPPSRP